MTILISVPGVGLISLTLRDIFQTLFAPEGGGDISSRIAKVTWRAVQPLVRVRRGVLSFAGPLAVLLVISTWTLSLTFGWALIIWPRLPDGFLLSPGLVPSENSGLLDAMYVSLVTLTTLGYGEITPLRTWLRFASPLEALIGFALITAVISWIMSISEVVSRRRQLSREIVLTRRSFDSMVASLGGENSPVMQGTLLSLAEQVIAVRNDLAQTPVSYYFHPSDPDSILPGTVDELLPLIDWAKEHGNPSVQMEGLLLSEAVTELATFIDGSFLDQSDGTVDAALKGYADDHRVT